MFQRPIEREKSHLQTRHHEDLAEKMYCYAFSTRPHSEVDPDFTGVNGRIFAGSNLLSGETIQKIQRFKPSIVTGI